LDLNFVELLVIVVEVILSLQLHHHEASRFKLRHGGAHIFDIVLGVDLEDSILVLAEILGSHFGLLID
jgi:hypothetical protein